MNPFESEGARDLLDANEFRCLVECERARSRRSRLPFSLLIANVDCGAAPSVAQILRSNLRAIDSVGRIGRARIGLLLPYTTDDEARSLQDVLSRDLESAGVSVSWGGDVLRLPVATSSGPKPSRAEKTPCTRTAELPPADARTAPRRRIVALLLITFALLVFASICCFRLPPSP